MSLAKRISRTFSIDIEVSFEIGKLIDTDNAVITKLDLEVFDAV